ncbi:MAG: LysR substrate-binding domain-containing protein [Steroidobacteraceae bacterium]
MNLRQLEAFRAVMMTGSVTNAAESLHLSQPAVSRLISELERSVGFKLFERVKGSTPLATPDGAALFQEVERSFSGLQVLRQAARDIRDFRTGNLRIVCLPALANSFIPAVIRTFRQLSPAVTIQLQTRSSSTVRLWVAAQQFDLGLATPGSDVSGVQAELFMRSRGVCVLPQGHPLAAKDSIAPADLRDEPFISLSLEDPARSKVDQAFNDAGITRNIVVETQFAMTICGLVAHGIGCAIVSAASVAEHVAPDCIIRPFEPRIEFQYVLYLPSHRPPSRIAASFLEHLKHVRDAWSEPA